MSHPKPLAQQAQNKDIPRNADLEHVIVISVSRTVHGKDTLQQYWSNHTLLMQKVRIVSQSSAELHQLEECNVALSNEVSKLRQKVKQQDLEMDELMARSPL